MRSVTALRRWLVFVAILRLFSVVLGYMYPHRLQGYLYTEKPEEVSDLQGRTFATWTLTSCLLCLICARNPCVPAIYGATLGSFIIALVHFLLEFFVFQTVCFRQLLNPVLVASVSTLWMGMGWNYYTSYAPNAEPSMSEETAMDPSASKVD